MSDLLVLNIGNTRTQLGIWRNDAVHETTTMPTASILGEEEWPEAIERYASLPCAAASVVPAATARLASRFSADRLCLVKAENIAGIDFSRVRAETVGADRLANVVAALHLFNPPLLVLDCGTAVTVEVVDGLRCFLGGAILPGREMMRRALHSHTAQLPYVPLTAEPPPDIGGHTEDAVRCGIDSGILGSVERLVSRARKAIHATDAPVIATGGDADYFRVAFPHFIRAEKTFTLTGVGVVGQMCL